MPAKLRLHAAPATLVFLAVTLALAVTVLVVLSGAEAAGQGQPKCGDKITTDTTLHKDLLDCPNNGIVIGADGITLDLNGHLIDGDGETPAAGCNPRKELCDVGVLNRGHEGVTVRHGSVRQFLVGVWALSVSHNRLLGISSAGNECCGLGFFRGTRSVMRKSSGRGNGGAPDEGNGMFLIASHHVRILANSFRNNGDGIFVGSKGAEATHNLIKGNLLSRNSNAIVLESSDRNRVRRNRSVRDGIGVLVALHGAQRNVIARNRIVHATQARGDGQGIEVPRGSHNVIARNSIRDTSQNAIALGVERVRAVGNVVRRNHIRGAGKDGVNVGGQAKRTLLRGNRVSHSKDDGLDVEGRTTKLTKNRAFRNGDLGIEAVPGVIDGGGNIARHNGDPRQCINIVCNE